MTQNYQSFDDGTPITILPPLPVPSIVDEANHRIANNLQFLSSWISLEARNIPDGQSRSAFERMQQRIAAIAALHRQLYRQGECGTIDLGEYIQELGGNMALNCPPQRHILVESVVLMVSIAQATAIGMIVSELVANACKYAYPAAVAGDVSIRLHPELRGYQVIVEDRGQGPMASPFGGGLGSALIAHLAGKMNAIYAWESAEPGTRFRLFVSTL